VPGQIDSGSLRQHGWIFADEFLFGRSVRATAALTFLESEHRFRQAIELRGIQFHRAVLRHLLHQRVGDAFKDEHLFLADA
jgi:hypothetical protein